MILFDVGDKMDKRYKIAIISAISFLIVIIGLFVVYFTFFYKPSFLKYSDNEYKFNYGVAFNVNKKNGIYNILEKDGNTKITIEVLKRNEVNGSSNNKDLAVSISDTNINDDTYSRVSFNCLDHICMSVYENDSKQVIVSVEFNEEEIYLYKLICDKKNADNYSDDFDLVMNSFIKNIK